MQKMKYSYILPHILEFFQASATRGIPLAAASGGQHSGIYPRRCDTTSHLDYPYIGFIQAYDFSYILFPCIRLLSQPSELHHAFHACPWRLRVYASRATSYEIP